MIDENDRNELVRYRVEQAFDTITEVQKLIETGLLKVAVNRIYYGMYYCLSALAIAYGFETSKHIQLIGWFNKSFVKKGRIEKKYGRILRNAFKNRTDSDYAPFIEYHEDEVKLMFEQMKEFIQGIADFIKTNK